MQVIRLIEHGTESFSVAVYLGGMTRFHLRVRNFALNAGLACRAGSRGRPSRILPFLHIGNPERPFIRLGS